MDRYGEYATTKDGIARVTNSMTKICITCRGIIPLLVILLIGVVYLLLYMDQTSHVNNILMQPATPPLVDPNPLMNQTEEKIILIWHKMWSGFGWNASSCPAYSCRMSTNRLDFEQAAAVVFHIPNDMGGLPPHANHNQTFVYFSMESPWLYARDIHAPRFTFNLTMTYKSGSDIQMLYGMIDKLENRVDYTPQYSFSDKTHNVSWLVSNCFAASGRMEYAKALARHIDVDIYGKCGIQCRNNCSELLASRYKFYLAFENSVCDEYVTEKFYRTLLYDVIPVVYGGADYSSIAPPGSFINILNYRSPKDLAHHLRYLSSNETAYMEYFQWKGRYKISLEKNKFNKGFCRLCEVLSTAGAHNVHEDAHHWFGHNACSVNVHEQVRSTYSSGIASGATDHQANSQSHSRIYIIISYSVLACVIQFIRLN